MESAASQYTYLFGPVSSRRLGLSLGVDLVPFKTCSLNCAYCECGATTTLTAERREYVPYDIVVDELRRYLRAEPPLDVITFAGSGEPTLFSRLGELIAWCKSSYPRYRTALLTNSSLLHDPAVRADILPVDYVLPSLDAISEEAFRRINRPAPGVSAQRIIDGLAAFASQYRGALWVELFIIPGINDSPEEIARFKQVLTAIEPSRVQLNSLDRPGACDWVTPAPAARLREIAAALLPLPVEIISRKAQQVMAQQHSAASRQDIYNAIARRPSTVEDLAVSLRATMNEINRHIDSLRQDGLIAPERLGVNLFYRKTDR
jgi:wyosine [tRNA(Phe)-imidazoG37] synthetase (radical SAM superfamily)